MEKMKTSYMWINRKANITYEQCKRYRQVLRNIYPRYLIVQQCIVDRADPIEKEYQLIEGEQVHSVYYRITILMDRVIQAKGAPVDLTPPPGPSIEERIERVTRSIRCISTWSRQANTENTNVAIVYMYANILRKLRATSVWKEQHICIVIELEQLYHEALYRLNILIVIHMESYTNEIGTTCYSTVDELGLPAMPSLTNAWIYFNKLFKKMVSVNSNQPRDNGKMDYFINTNIERVPILQRTRNELWFRYELYKIFVEAQFDELYEPPSVGLRMASINELCHLTHRILSCIPFLQTLFMPSVNWQQILLQTFVANLMQSIQIQWNVYLQQPKVKETFDDLVVFFETL